MTRKTITRLVTAGAALLTAAAIGTGAAGSASAYIFNCGEPITVSGGTLTFKDGKQYVDLSTRHIVDPRTGKAEIKITKKNLLRPDYAKAAQAGGTFTVPVPKQFRGKKMRVVVQFVTVGNITPAWMNRDKTFEVNGDGYQVWSFTKMTTKSKNITVTIPAGDFNMTDFRFEVTYESKKTAPAAYRVVPKGDDFAFAQRDNDNGLSRITVS